MIYGPNMHYCTHDTTTHETATGTVFSSNNTLLHDKDALTTPLRVRSLGLKEDKIEKV